MSCAPARCWSSSPPKGLKLEAVHETRLRVGEGLVGDIASHARPLALADAQSHPNFAYRPETGEEIYRSLMGVPILRGGRVIGVLVVQNRTARQYTEEEVEALETTAMVVAELIAGGDLVPRNETRPTEGIGLLPTRLEGLSLCPGPRHRPRRAAQAAPDSGRDRGRESGPRARAPRTWRSPACTGPWTT